MALLGPQVGFAPCFLGAFLGISGTLNGLTLEQNVAKLKRVSVAILTTGHHISVPL